MAKKNASQDSVEKKKPSRKPASKKKVSAKAAAEAAFARRLTDPLAPAKSLESQPRLNFPANAMTLAAGSRARTYVFRSVTWQKSSATSANTRSTCIASLRTWLHTRRTPICRSSTEWFGNPRMILPCWDVWHAKRTYAFHFIPPNSLC